MRRVVLYPWPLVFLLFLSFDLLASLGPLAAQHPPVAGRYDEADWVTLSDFRHVTAVAAGDAEAYVGTAGGVEILVVPSHVWSGTVTAGDGLPSSVVTALAFDSRGGKLWVGTPLGLAIYDPFRGEVLQDPLRLGPVTVREIRMAAGEPQAFVMAGGRWFKSDPFALSAEPVADAGVPPAPAAVDLEAIPFLGGGRVRGERSGRPEAFRLTDAARLFDGRLLLGTWGANAHVYDPGRLSAEPRPYGLAGSGGGAIGWDRERLWFSNVPAGVVAGGRLADRELATSGVAVEDRGALASASADLADWTYAYPGLEPGLASDRAYDVAGWGERVIFATEGGLAIFDPADGRWSRPAALATLADKVLAVEPAADGLWLGTRRGLLAVRGEGDPAVASEPGSWRVVGRWLEDRTVYGLAADARELYAGTDRGLFRIAPREETSPDAPANWALSQVETVGTQVIDLALLEEEVVIASDRGVEVLPRRGGEPELFLVGEGSLGEPPLALAADAFNVWVGTRAGVSRWDRQRRLWTDYRLEDGLPDLPVLDVLIQDERFVWFSTPGGVTRFAYGEPGS